jgi:sigma-E factor negative regulatory protein RseB
MLAVRPHDEYRYGHRIWLDTEHAFPLKTELVNVDGEVIEQIKFADIRIGGNLSADILAPTVNIDSFTWVTEPSKYEVVTVATDWISSGLPAGFQAVSTRNERKDGATDTITHIVFSDGLADVSVFITENGDKETVGASRAGTSNSYSVEHGDFHITAIGKVPPTTVQRIATSMTKQQ